MSSHTWASLRHTSWQSSALWIPQQDMEGLLEVFLWEDVSDLPELRHWYLCCIPWPKQVKQSVCVQGMDKHSPISWWKALDQPAHCERPGQQIVGSCAAFTITQRIEKGILSSNIMRESQEVVTSEQISNAENSFQVLRIARTRPPSYSFFRHRNCAFLQHTKSNLMQRTLHMGSQVWTWCDLKACALCRMW